MLRDYHSHLVTGSTRVNSRAATTAQGLTRTNTPVPSQALTPLDSPEKPQASIRLCIDGVMAVVQKRDATNAACIQGAEPAASGKIEVVTSHAAVSELGLAAHFALPEPLPHEDQHGHEPAQSEDANEPDAVETTVLTADAQAENHSVAPSEAVALEQTLAVVNEQRLRAVDDKNQAPQDENSNDVPSPAATVQGVSPVTRNGDASSAAVALEQSETPAAVGEHQQPAVDDENQAPQDENSNDVLSPAAPVRGVSPETEKGGSSEAVALEQTAVGKHRQPAVERNLIAAKASADESNSSSDSSSDSESEEKRARRLVKKEQVDAARTANPKQGEEGDEEDDEESSDDKEDKEDKEEDVGTKVSNFDLLLNNLASLPRSKYCATTVYSAWRRSERNRKSRMVCRDRKSPHNERMPQVASKKKNSARQNLAAQMEAVKGDKNLIGTANYFRSGIKSDAAVWFTESDNLGNDWRLCHLSVPCSLGSAQVASPLLQLCSFNVQALILQHEKELDYDVDKSLVLAQMFHPGREHHALLAIVPQPGDAGHVMAWSDGQLPFGANNLDQYNGQTVIMRPDNEDPNWKAILDDWRVQVLWICGPSSRELMPSILSELPTCRCRYVQPIFNKCMQVERTVLFCSHDSGSGRVYSADMRPRHACVWHASYQQVRYEDRTGCFSVLRRLLDRTGDATRRKWSQVR